MAESQPAENGAAQNNAESSIVAAISSTIELLVSSITSLKSTMTYSISQMKQKDTIDQLVIEYVPSEEMKNKWKLPPKWTKTIYTAVGQKGAIWVP